MVQYFDYRNFVLESKLLITHLILIVHDLFWGFFVAQSLVLMYLLQFMLRGRLSKSKIIGRLWPYRKIIGGFQNIDNRYQ
jgi:hypothetical protein